MWRLWTKGWGPKAWWYWASREGWPIFIAKHLPARVTLWAFILVYAHADIQPGEEYRVAYDAWARVHNLT